jgi:hypothetical protein
MYFVGRGATQRVSEDADEREIAEEEANTERKATKKQMQSNA